MNTLKNSRYPQELEVPVTDESYDELLDTLKSLAKDTDRHKGKKERSRQKSTFRDILRSMEVSCFLSFISCQHVKLCLVH